MKIFTLVFLGFAIFLGVVISPFASSWPDGLEKTAEKLGFIEKATNLINSPLPDYTIPFMKNQMLSTSLSGLMGTLLAFALLSLLGYIFLRKEG